MAKFKDIKEILYKKIPKAESYFNESYGDFNCEKLKDVKKILYAVTPTRKVQEYFEEHSFDLLICHHIGYFRCPQMTFHTALDFCDQGLTNYWATKLNIKDPKYVVKNAGLYGEIDPISFKDLCENIKKYSSNIDGQCISKNDIINNIAVCSGLGTVILSEVEDLNIDCYILGESSYNFDNTKLNGIIEIGHTRSERIGGYIIEEFLKELDVSVEIAPLGVDEFGGEVYSNASWFSR